MVVTSRYCCVPLCLLLYSATWLLINCTTEIISTRVKVDYSCSNLCALHSIHGEYLMSIFQSQFKSVYFAACPVLVFNYGWR